MVRGDGSTSRMGPSVCCAGCALIRLEAEGTGMPSRRTLELVVIVVLALEPVKAMAKLWSIRTLATTPPGSVLHGVAELGSVIL
jgi:hypothetical protein